MHTVLRATVGASRSGLLVDGEHFDAYGSAKSYRVLRGDKFVVPYMSFSMRGPTAIIVLDSAHGAGLTP
jgi:hypothetical protein